MTNAEMDTKIRDLLEENGWRRWNTYIGHKIARRWDDAYEFFGKQLKEEGETK